MALDACHTQLIEEGTQLFTDRSTLDLLFQELSENFYPERADFTVKRTLGEDFAANLDTSYPIVARRDLGNQIGAMLRPTSKPWFHNGIKQEEVKDEAGREWLEMTDRVQRKALNDRGGLFGRATKEADHDWATFGQAVISSELAFLPVNGPTLLHRTWHLRDVAWSENSYGQINAVHRKWKPGARELAQRFPNCSQIVKDLAKKEPFKEVEVRHVMVMETDFEKKFEQPWVSVWLEINEKVLLREDPSWTQYYVIPRWETVSGSQYAYSPATIAALPDARLLQAMTYTLLTAGEYAVEPPLIGVQEAIKGGIEMYPGGFTAIDASYDERLGEVLRPLDTGKDRALPLGLKMNQDIRQQLAEAFYLTKLSLPDAGQGGMSPYEISQRMEQYVRQNLPLFEPMEQDYNGALMDQDFSLLFRAGAFGSPQNIPESLQGKQTEFTFESPLHENIERMKGQTFAEAGQYLMQAAQLDPVTAKMVNVKEALRDVLHGIQVPASWMVEEAELEKIEKQLMEQQQQQQMMQMAQQGGEAAQSVGAGVEAMTGGGEQQQAAQ